MVFGRAHEPGNHFELLVLKSGWPVKRYGEFIGNALIAALLPHEG